MLPFEDMLPQFDEEIAYKYRDPWFVGYISTIILLKPIIDIDDWKKFYFSLDKIRNKKLDEIDVNIAVDLRKKFRSKNIPRTYLDINLENGRTEDDINGVAAFLHKDLPSEHYISLSECREAIDFIVFTETFYDLILKKISSSCFGASFSRFFNREGPKGRKALLWNRLFIKVK